MGRLRTIPISDSRYGMGYWLFGSIREGESPKRDFRVMTALAAIRLRVLNAEVRSRARRPGRAICGKDTRVSCRKAGATVTGPSRHIRWALIAANWRNCRHL